MKRYRIISTMLVFCLFIGGFGLWSLLKAPDEFSSWERRRLEQPPKLTVETLISGEFFSDAETYLTDQFPLRDQFRQLKAITQHHLLLQKDAGGYYMAESSLSKLDATLSETSVSYACTKFNFLYDRYLAPYGSTAYYCVVPDKNMYLAAPNGYPAMDYDALYRQMSAALPMEEIRIDHLLEVGDYYATDSHWRQETLLDVADTITNVLGNGTSPTYETVHAGDFLGVYAGQSALPLRAEPLYYLTNEELAGCTVLNHETQKTTGIYNTAAFNNVDPYDIFLSGATPLLTITNPAGDPEKELLVFRDSFGSSLVPLLVHGYGTVTVIDTRYIAPAMLPQFVDFHGQDALFLYSTLLINSSSSLR